MPINYAEKYANKIDERFKIGALSTPAVNNDYDFVGVQTVKVYSVPTAAMNDYTKTGASRYGTPAELENSVQEMTLSRDRSFTFTIDRANYDDTMMLNSAGIALQRQLDVVVIPEMDIYRFSVICANASTITSAKAITKTNAYESFLDGTVALTDKKCPLGGRVAYVSPNFYKCIKLDETFIQASDIAQNMLLKGQVGQVDGIPIIVVPASYLPEGVEFFITKTDTKRAEMKIGLTIHFNAKKRL